MLFEGELPERQQVKNKTYSFLGVFMSSLLFFSVQVNCKH